jgi:tetratricopeptide (TPR) repeat protein
VFDECWLTYIKSSYYLMACSHEEIGLRPSDRLLGNEVLRGYLADRHALAVEQIPYCVLSTDAFRLIGEATEINTLDRPVLEHHMARLASGTRLFRFTDRLIERANLDEVRRRLGAEFDWQPGGFALWAERRLHRDSLLLGALDRIVLTRFGDVSDSYVAAAREAAEQMGTAVGYEEIGRSLYKRGLYDPAVVAFRRGLELDAERFRSRYYLGRSYERLGQAQLAADQFAEALRLRPDDDDARDALERVMRPHE